MTDRGLQHALPLGSTAPAVPALDSGWRSLGDLARTAMEEALAARKLPLIAKLSRQEIEGWRAELRAGHRAAFPGELAALAQRQKELEAR